MELTSGREGPRIQGFQFHPGYSISELLGNPRGHLMAKGTNDQAGTDDQAGTNDQAGTDDQALCLCSNQSSVAFI